MSWSKYGRSRGFMRNMQKYHGCEEAEALKRSPNTHCPGCSLGSSACCHAHLRIERPKRLPGSDFTSQSVNGAPVCTICEWHFRSCPRMSACAFYEGLFKIWEDYWSSSPIFPN